jgi:hypothetical protein
MAAWLSVSRMASGWRAVSVIRSQGAWHLPRRRPPRNQPAEARADAVDKGAAYVGAHASRWITPATGVKLVENLLDALL